MQRNRDVAEIHPYTYTITRISDGLQYHGVRYRNIKTGISPINDLGKRYFTSGIFKKDFRSTPSNFSTKIRWTFSSIEDALLWESLVNRRLMHRKTWANAAIGKGCADVGKLKERREAACMKKYGVPHVMMVKEIRNNLEKSIVKLYGVKNVGSSPVIRKKVIETSLKKFGVECSFQSGEVKEKIKNSMLNRFGVDNPNKSPIVREKTKQTNLKNFGCEYGFQRTDVIQKIHDRRKEMYVKLAKMDGGEFSKYLSKISQHIAVQNQKKSQRNIGIKILETT